MGHKGPEVRGDGQLQAGGVAPVLQLVGEKLHGHGFVLPERLLEQVHCQRPELTERHQLDQQSVYIYFLYEAYDVIVI